MCFKKEYLLTEKYLLFLTLIRFKNSNIAKCCHFGLQPVATFVKVSTKYQFFKIKRNPAIIVDWQERIFFNNAKKKILSIFHLSKSL